MKRIIVSALNDLATDQRVDKVCTVLHELGYNVLLIGRKSSSIVSERKYNTQRISLFFNKGFFFFAEFNTRLFFKLLFLKKNVLLANDLDTLLPNFIISKFFRKKIVYDSHELYTEMPEVIARPHIQKFWLRIEAFIFPKLKNIYTVNPIIAAIYSEKYHVPISVVRNIAPSLKNKEKSISLSKKIKKNAKMLILQGAGINIDRGAEEAIEMMQYLENTILYIIGSGEVFSALQKLVIALSLEDKVFLMGRMPYLELMEYTKIADIGLSLDKGSNLNYEYSLPNKIFDYMQAEIPLLVSNRKMVADLVKQENIGIVTNTHDPKKLAETIKNMLENNNANLLWKKNLKQCSAKYSWENEKKQLLKIYANLA